MSSLYRRSEWLQNNMPVKLRGSYTSSNNKDKSGVANSNIMQARTETTLHTGMRIRSKQTPWQANYTDRAVATCRRSWCQVLRVEGCRVGSATGEHDPINLSFLDRSRYFIHASSSSVYPRETEQIPLRTHYFSQNLAAPGIEPGTSGSATGNCGDKTTEAVM
jgi:hypothetical protein